MIDRVYDRFMHVCNKSGHRGKGLQTRLSDAGSFVRILSKLNHESDLFREMEWMIKNAEAIHQFFSAINDCCFAIVPSEIVKGVIKLKKIPMFIDLWLWLHCLLYLEVKESACKKSKIKTEFISSSSSQSLFFKRILALSNHG